MEDGDISIVDGGGITELDPAGDRLLVDISGFVDERDVRRTISRVSSEAEPEPPRGKIKHTPKHSDQTVSVGRDALRQTRGQLPGLRPARINTAVASC